ncbi:hypothetical protein LEP1GSC087_0319 [Leptospira interrogans serovar Bataviae str. L1111]|uniref:Uncharacterized protein n=1 Tax=Leptospira interrogans serovar Australis str. 200703203 TaxID=1085541 RepID=N1UHP2_LEPIR|nr:hypothetical protein LEP1GSC087_0319 [Leptospira interrogans serovar Bataviae str. L1111]EMY25793.1 hypothetical protein LEP1GSC115_2823 [Leptospira interrogans serovar Australis str. 200703203]
MKFIQKLEYNFPFKKHKFRNQYIFYKNSSFIFIHFHGKLIFLFLYIEKFEFLFYE